MTAALPSALRRSSAHVFVESLDVPTLDAADAHHLRRALRLRDGAELTVSDGAGCWSRAELTADGVALVGAREQAAEPARHVTVAAAIPKGDRLDWMVHKLTEIGVTHIVLLDCARSVVRWDDDRAERHVSRLRRVVREAAMQSRRTRLPDLLGPVPFGDVRNTAGLLVADPQGPPLGRTSSDVTVAIGPEGGFTPGELADTTLVSVGHQVLRVETAALAAAVLLCR